MKERIYLGGFEVYREFGGDGSTVELERETLHVMDGQQRIALVETKTRESQSPIPNPQPLIRYQFGNHLGSVGLELDDTGAVISYEEYYPYGSTSYQAGRNAAEVGLKRYRYTGKERDEETGFDYHGLRYKVHWLGRWSTADPLGLVDGLNLYAYARNNPIGLRDPSGGSGITMSDSPSEKRSDSLAEKPTQRWTNPIRINPIRGTSIQHDGSKPISEPSTDQAPANGPTLQNQVNPSGPTDAEYLENAVKHFFQGEPLSPNNPFQQPMFSEQPGGLAEEVFLGDFYEGEPTAAGIGINIGIGLLPVVGTAADIRDLGGSISNAVKNPTSGWVWAGVAIAGVAFIPGLGDALKGAAKGGLGEKMIKSQKKSGLNVDVAAQPFHKKTDFRKGSGKKVEAAHMVPTVAVGKLQNYSRSRALTVLLPRKLHRQFDAEWMKEARKLRRRGITEITVQEWEMMLVDAAHSVKGLKGRTADTMAFMIRIEFYQTLGLEPTLKLPLPKLK